MYDVEKGIYPPGVYVVGEDIELGKYILQCLDGDKDTAIITYASYAKYKNEDILSVERFDNDYFVSLREKGMVISVRNAEIRRL